MIRGSFRGSEPLGTVDIPLQYPYYFLPIIHVPLRSLQLAIQLGIIIGINIVGVVAVIITCSGWFWLLPTISPSHPPTCPSLLLF